MKQQVSKIAVTGDICVNRLIWTTSPQSYEGLNWQSQTQLHSISRPGEALLLAEMVALATGKEIISPVIAQNPATSENRYLSSFAELEPFASSPDSKEDKVYRVSKFMGFAGTASGKPELLPIENDDANVQIVIIDDENNGFNNESVYWPKAVKDIEKTPVILYKMNNPIGDSALWHYLDRYHIERTIVIINADDLRSKGVNISKSLSWEKTALDFVWQLSNNPNLSFLATCRHLIVPFGLEGVIYYKNDGTAESKLYFLPYEFEGDFTRESLGKMYGLTSAFVAGLSAAIAKSLGEDELPALLSEGIRQGMAAARKHFILGFGKSPDCCVFPNPLIFEQNENDSTLLGHVQDVKIPNIKSRDRQDRWYILHEKSSASIAQIAFDLVINGEEKALKSIPTARFGRLKTVDRTEIESYRTIRNLISEYIQTKNTTRPLSIAVFGTPGSGKSYGLTEMASSMFPNVIQKMNYNLSQFRSPKELFSAFHKISDYNLLDKIPLIVFDEFDSYFEGKLGWLKYFLSPMQDGVYRGEESVHPIGKAIFVFAGGTSSSFAEFCGEKIEDDKKQAFLNEFKAAKGPDFVSRLRGYVDILGPNQTDDSDHLYIIRRAMLLRSLIERKFPHLINEKGEAQIDNGVLRAMLKIPKYKHEARSVEAIMDMSMLTQAKKWEQSFLPPKEQLRLHVDENQFLRYMMHDAVFSEKIDDLAKLLRQKYNALPDATPVAGDDPSIPWKKLGEEAKSFYREHVKNIPEALLLIQYDVLYVDNKVGETNFSEDEIKELAQFEYKRRFNQKREEYKRQYEETKKVPLSDVPALAACVLSTEETKTQIRQMVRLWAGVLAESNFKVERIRFANQFDPLKE